MLPGRKLVGDFPTCYRPWIIFKPPQIYKDAIELTSERKLRFGQTFFQIEVRNVLYKVVMVTNPYHPSGRIPSPSNWEI